MPKKKRRTDGKLLEMMIRTTMIPLGFEEIPKNNLRHSCMFRGKRLLIKNTDYIGLYGTPGRHEWTIVDEKHTYTVECKKQDTSGSVDEKLPFITRTFSDKPSEDYFLLIYYGDHFTKSDRGIAAIKWVRAEAERLCKEFHPRKFMVFTVEQFTDFATERWSP